MRLMQRQQGFSLIEVLVAVVILSVGILGIAGLQVVSLQQNRSSLLRSEAIQIGNDIFDRMRANRTENYAPVAFTDQPPSATNCVNDTVECSTEQMEAFDVASWKCRLDPIDSSTSAPYDVCDTLGITTGALPGGQGSISFTNVSSGVTGEPPFRVFEVRVRWIDDAQGNYSDIVVRTQAGEEEF